MVRLPTIRPLYLVLGFVGLVLVGNVVLLDFFLVKQRSELLDFQTRLGTLSDSFKLLGNRFSLFPGVTKESSGSAKETTAEIQQFLAGETCSQACVSLIQTATASAGNTVFLNRTPTSSLIVPSSGGGNGTKGDFVIPLGSGTIPPGKANQWYDAYTAQVSFDTADFPPVKSFTFEVVMHVASGNIQAKLVDDTTPFSYDGQVLTTSSNTGQLLSASVPLLSGKKTYHVRLYETIDAGGTLDAARIHLITQ